MRRLCLLAAVLLALAAAGLIVMNLRVPLRDVIRLNAPCENGGVPVQAALPCGGVDINHADAQTLEQLPGIGPAMAGRIIAEREANGLFSYPEDLQSVHGIGEKTLEKLRDQIQINK